MSDYNNFASTFSKSRQNMRWPEIDYILDTPGFCLEWMHILDVGCGNGRLIDSLEKKMLPWQEAYCPPDKGVCRHGDGEVNNASFNYLGTDSSSGMIEEARRLHPGRDFSVCDMLELERMANRWPFDRIVFLASFHHLRDASERLRVLEQTHALLASDGIIAMTNWHLLGTTLFPRYESMYRWSGDFDIKIGAHSRYYHSFGIEELSDLFKKTGYQIIENAVSGTGKNIISLLSKK